MPGPIEKRESRLKIDYLGVHQSLYRRIADGERKGWSSDPEVAAMLAQIKKAMAMPKFPLTGMLLELGCGDGCLTASLAGLGNYRISGIDVVPLAVSLAERRLRRFGLEAELVIGSVLDLPWPDETFDLVVDGHCLHCIIAGDRKRFFSETRRVLKPGGLLLVMTMTGDPPNKLVPHFDLESRSEVIKGVAVRYFGRSEDILGEVSDSGLKISDYWLVQSEDETDQDELFVSAFK